MYRESSATCSAEFWSFWRRLTLRDESYAGDNGGIGESAAKGCSESNELSEVVEPWLNLVREIELQTAGTMVTPSDFKRRSASDKHGCEVKGITRRVRGGVDLENTVDEWLEKVANKEIICDGRFAYLSSSLSSSVAST